MQKISVLPQKPEDGNPRDSLLWARLYYHVHRSFNGVMTAKQLAPQFACFRHPNEQPAVLSVTFLALAILIEPSYIVHSRDRQQLPSSLAVNRCRLPLHQASYHGAICAASSGRSDSNRTSEVCCRGEQWKSLRAAWQPVFYSGRYGMFKTTRSRLQKTFF